MPLELTPCMFAAPAVVASPYASFAPRLAERWAEQCDVPRELAARATDALLGGPAAHLGPADRRVAIQTVEFRFAELELSEAEGALGEPFGEAWLHALLSRTAEVTERESMR